MTTPPKPALLVVAVLLALPRASAACAMCTSAQDDAVQLAFAVASLFMTLMPLAAVGGVVWYLRRRAQKLHAEEVAGVIRLPLAGERGLRRS